MYIFNFLNFQRRQFVSELLIKSVTILHLQKLLL